MDKKTLFGIKLMVYSLVAAVVICAGIYMLQDKLPHTNKNESNTQWDYIGLEKYYVMIDCDGFGTAAKVCYDHSNRTEGRLCGLQKKEDVPECSRDTYNKD
jgi:hypothetical protein